jgi:preprotein translocase subunit SecE
MKKVTQYFKDAYQELINNVTWTPMDELQNYTTIVLVSLVLITMLILVMDKISEIVMVNGIYNNL